MAAPRIALAAERPSDPTRSLRMTGSPKAEKFEMVKAPPEVKKPLAIASTAGMPRKRTAYTENGIRPIHPVPERAPRRREVTPAPRFVARAVINRPQQPT